MQLDLENQSVSPGWLTRGEELEFRSEESGPRGKRILGARAPGPPDLSMWVKKEAHAKARRAGERREEE